MSTSTLILGESGSGKSASLRNLKASETLLIQAVRKPLPFRSKEWAEWHKTDKPTGNIWVLDQSHDIVSAMSKTKRKVIVLDDFQYVLANEYMRRSDQTGFQKFSDIGRHAWDILTAASALAQDVRVYILAHTDTDDTGRIKAKTIGKLLDEKICVEGMFSVVLRTNVINGQYLLSTHNNGQDTVKTPMGMFEDDHIDNDLAAVDAAIVDYYGLAPQPA
jgi:adenosyl cobinamide kinase/adenosyl cobinamide phosphate guanylyltransferase